MKEVFIRYNPYKLETEVLIDGRKPRENSPLIVGDKRLQEWVEELPLMLVDEYNDTAFDITFHGTLLDFEDLSEVFKTAFDNNELKAKLYRQPAKETSDKEALIDNVFEEILQGMESNI